MNSFQSNLEKKICHFNNDYIIHKSYIVNFQPNIANDHIQIVINIHQKKKKKKSVSIR
jgi:hypothetical protein